MKLREIIERVDRSKSNKNKPCYRDFAGNEFGIYSNLNEPWDEGRLKSYGYATWLCTDTQVGGRIYFLDDEPVAISWQSARKSSEDIEWISKEARSKVREYLLSLVIVEDDNQDYADLDVELNDGFHVSYGSQLLTKNLVVKETGEKVTVIKSYHKYEDINSWQTVEVEFEDGRKELMNLSELLILYNIK